VVGQFLAELDGIEKLVGVVVLAATNRPDMVDPALLRPGRFDVVVEIPMPNEKERLAILQVQVRGKPVAKEVNLVSLASNTDGLTGADLGAICNRAAMNAIRDRIAETEEGVVTASSLPLHILSRHFEAALSEFRS